jgi:ThiF family
MDRRLRLIQHGGGEDEAEILAALDDPTIRIVLPPGTPSFSHQLLALALVDLLARLFPRIDVVCDPAARADAALPAGEELLAARLQHAREHGIPPQAAGEAAITINIGPDGENADLCADGSGWQAYLGTQPSRLPDSGSRVSVGALVAACRAAAHTFARLLANLLEAQPTPASDYFSALTYRTAETPFEEPTAEVSGALEGVLVGVGSIGGAAVYLLARTPGLAGELAIIDPQSLESHNLDRAILATAADTEAERVKVEVAADAVAHLDRLSVDPRKETISGYLASRPPEQPLPLVLCAVDSPSSRRAMQDCLPLELINAACNPREVMISGHRTDEGPCVCCLHMAEMLDGEQIRARLIAQATGLTFEQVVVRMNQRAPLEPQTIMFIELRTSRPEGSLAGYVGETLETLWEEQLMYGAVQVQASGGAVGAVAAPWVTALAGFLLAGEALKATGGTQLAGCRLGAAPVSPATRYVEAIYASPRYAQLTRPARWVGSECLCRSPRRLRLMRRRYGLPDQKQ